MLKQVPKKVPKPPLISVVVPVAPGGSIKMLTDSLKKANYPKDRIEVIVAEGKKPAYQRNLASKKAKGDYIFFFDDDVAVEKNAIRELLKGFKSGAELVGGPNLTPSADSLIQKAHGRAMASFFGAAKMKTRYVSEGDMREAGETDLILCNLAVTKKAFLKEGGFKEDLYPNEENYLFNQMRAHGKKLIYNPRAVVYHSRRDSIGKMARQVFHYGGGRREQTFMQPSSFSPMFLVPSAFFLYLVSLALYQPLWYFWPLRLYIIADLVFSLWNSRRDPMYFFILPWMFPLIHISYGAGFLFGWIFRRKGARSREVTIKKVRL